MAPHQQSENVRPVRASTAAPDDASYAVDAAPPPPPPLDNATLARRRPSRSSRESAARAMLDLLCFMLFWQGKLGLPCSAELQRYATQHDCLARWHVVRAFRGSGARDAPRALRARDGAEVVGRLRQSAAWPGGVPPRARRRRRAAPGDHARDAVQPRAAPSARGAAGRVAWPRFPRALHRGAARRPLHRRAPRRARVALDALPRDARCAAGGGGLVVGLLHAVHDARQSRRRRAAVPGERPTQPRPRAGDVDARVPRRRRPAPR